MISSKVFWLKIKLLPTRKSIYPSPPEMTSMELFLAREAAELLELFGSSLDMAIGPENRLKD